MSWYLRRFRLIEFHMQCVVVYEGGRCIVCAWFSVWVREDFASVVRLHSAIPHCIKVFYYCFYIMLGLCQNEWLLCSVMCDERRTLQMFNIQCLNPNVI